MKMRMLRIVKQNVRFFSNATGNIKRELKNSLRLEFKVRSMRIEDIPQIVELTRRNNFQFPVSALKFWHTQDPDGMKAAVTESGEVIGTLFNVKNTEKLYIGGVFCVQEKYRHLDVGRKLLTECIAHAQGENFAVNTDIHKIGPYIRRGITVLETDWKSIEYETYTPVNPTVLLDKPPSGVEILAFQNSHLPAIYEYDYSLAGYERKSLIEASCNEENSKTLVAMKDGKCVGFGSMKLSIAEYGRIGPLYADDPSVAETMVKRLIIAMPEAKGFAMVTNNTNIFANMIPEKLNVPIHNSLYRMYKKERVHINTKKVFAHLDIDFAPF